MGGVSIDRAIWDSLVQQINRCIRHRVDAEDLLQTAYLRFMSYPRRAMVDNVQAFLVRTAINIHVDNYRRERFMAGIATEVRSGSEAPPLQDEILAARTSLKRVKEGLSRLHPRTREILIMHRLENMKYRDIAKRFEISESAVEKHIAKGTLFLGKWMEGW